MADQVQPALTPDQWRTQELHVSGGEGVPWIRIEATDGRLRIDSGDPMFSETVSAAEAHGIAALALHQQPFGFTRSDVEILHELGIKLRAAGVSAVELENVKSVISGLADRITALLPPEV